MAWFYFKPKFEYEKASIDIDDHSAWTGHKYFIYDFIRNIKPKVIVELGTHYGTSFFSMCQAVKDAKLKTELYAVDTWKGDEHTGYYDESVFKQVREIKRTYYLHLRIKLLKKTFDQAANDFSQESIDLLHIDGLHTYRAVKHDFNNWLDKVTKTGTIILHDTHEKGDDFEVHKLWGELKKQFKTLEFSHAHGLGILFKNPKPFAKIFNFQEIWKHYYPLVFENKTFKKQINDLNSQLSQNQSENQQLRKQISESTTSIAILKSEIETKNKKIKQLEKKLKAIEKEKQKRAEELQKENENIRQQIQQTKTHIENLELTLNKIKSAKFFRLWQGYCKIRDKLLLRS